MQFARPDAVLIVEDEALVSLMIEDLVREMGARVIDVFAAAADALAALATGHYDCAILDVVVRDGTTLPVADALEARGIPYLFSTGVVPDTLEPRHRNRTFLAKPFEDSVLHSHILNLLLGRPD